jgi:ABC-type nitrate/sulfonate/bicarbonate transport system substrate-binding protein
MKKKQVEIVSILIIITAMFISGCGNTATPAPTPIPDAVNVQLSWFHSAEFAGFYAAIDQGFYAENNMVVTLTPGSPDINPMDKVQDNSAQFGVNTGDSIITARDNGQNFVAVSSIYRVSPLVIGSLNKSNITTPKDLVGKKVGVFTTDFSTTWDIQLLAMLKRLKIDKNEIDFVPIDDFHGANELTSKKMDAVSGMFATNEPVVANLEGNPLNLIYYKDYGVDVYSNVIFVSENLISKNPDLIARFVKATLKGYQYAIENPETAAKLALTYDNTLDLTVQTETMKAQIPLISTGDSPIGTMDADVWNTTQEILLEFGLISKSIDLNTIYTNKFVTP